MRRTVPGLTAVIALLVGACTTSRPPRDVDPTPRRIDRPAATAPAPRAALPFTWSRAPVVDPGWDDVPVERDGLFLGIHAARAQHVLRFVAVDSSGTIRWRAERPPTCTGYALSRAGKQAVAVLTDTGPDPGTVSASGYALATGRKLWGPVPVPGPYQGPGLVFAAPAPQSAMGATGPRRALDPATGRTVAQEHPGRTDSVIGEYDGTVLLSDGARLRALDTGSGTLRWTRALPHPGAWQSAAAEPAPPGAALLRGRDAATLIDLADGSVIGRHVHGAGRAEDIDAWVTITDHTVRATRDGELLWERQLYTHTRLAAVGPALVYLRVGNRVQVVNTLTGKDAVAYPPGRSRVGYAVPALISHATSGAVVRTERDILLLTTERAR